MSDFILASASPHRKALLVQIGFEPAQAINVDIDETPKIGEKPTAYVKRMALEKARAGVVLCQNQVVLAGDTVLVCGGKIIQKSHNDKEQIEVMNKLSGKAHHVLSAVCVISKDGKTGLRVSDTKVLMKKLSKQEIEEYVQSKEWVGCVGYQIEGVLGGFVRKIVGSYSGVVGLPLFEARNLLLGAGVK